MDTTAPVIILNGDSEIDFALGSEYTDAGATVSDNLDTDLELVVENSVDASAVGVYQVKFNITDSTGNKATEVVRTVNVKDLTAPVIALAGDAEVTHEGGADDTDAGATVTDNLDSDVELVVVNPVDVSTLGEYTIT